MVYQNNKVDWVNEILLRLNLQPIAYSAEMIQLTDIYHQRWILECAEDSEILFIYTYLRPELYLHELSRETLLHWLSLNANLQLMRGAWLSLNSSRSSLMLSAQHPIVGLDAELVSNMLANLVELRHQLEVELEQAGQRVEYVGEGW